MASLGCFIYIKKKKYFYKTTYLRAAILFVRISNGPFIAIAIAMNGPFEIRTIPIQNMKTFGIRMDSVFEWIRYSNVRYSSPHCIFKLCYGIQEATGLAREGLFHSLTLLTVYIECYTEVRRTLTLKFFFSFLYLPCSGITPCVGTVGTVHDSYT